MTLRGNKLIFLKMKNIFAAICLMVFSIAHADQGWDEETSVWDVLEFFGSPVPEELENSRALSRDMRAVENGRQLIEYGRLKNDIGTPISTHYQCIDCHNAEADAVGLSVSPDQRLHALKGDMIMSQGSSFKGIVNREAWYNGIWGIKYGQYGEMFGVANQDLPKAVELCSSICSQGRMPSEQEREYMLAYFWSLELKLSDLDLSQQDFELLEMYRGKYQKAVEDQSEFKTVLQGSAARFLKAKYEITAPAVHGNPVLNLEASGSAANGKLVYEKACRQCHGEQAVHIKMPAGKGISPIRNAYQNGLLVHYIRNGTLRGSEDEFSYMPLFTQQRLSDGQIVDLAAYLRKLARQ